MLLKRIIRLGNMVVKHMNLDDQQFLEELGSRIRERRIARKLTQAHLAEKCHLHRTFIGSVERGERNIAILNLRLIAKNLRVPLHELLADTGKASKLGRA
jgi:transcriptional regulator with XRE-family HTH domain